MSRIGAGLFVASGALLLGYFQYQKAQIQEQKEIAKNEGFGKPKVGGPFALVDYDGKLVTDKTYRGKYMLIYFGYTFCPDVCPEELEKMAEIYEYLSKFVINCRKRWP